MSEILNKYKKQKQRLLLNTQKYLDFVLSLDNSKTINLDGNLTKKCLISYIDTNNEECFDDKSLVSMSGYTYENSINEGETLKDLGFTNVDNGHIYYDKNELTLDDFVNIITNVSYTLPQNDERLHLYPVNGNSQYYTYNTEVVSESGSTYYAMKGGYLQGFYKLYGFNYQVLPQDIENCWCLEFVIRPRTDYVVSGNTINDEHPNNKGIFFYMGTRSENKFGRFYGEDLTKYLSRQNYSGECFEICEKKEGQETDKELNRKLLEIMYGVDNVKCKSYTDDEVENMLSGLTLCKVDLSTSDGHKLENNNYFEITTDNKFIIFDRTCGGFTTNNWNNDNVLSLIQKKIVNHENLFLLMDRTCKGKTTSTIENYLNSTTGDSSDYSILKDIKGIKILTFQNGIKNNYAYYPVVFDEKVFGKSRDQVKDELEKNDIYTRKYFYPLISEYECYREQYNAKETPIANKIAKNVLTLPMYANLDIKDVDKIVSIILNKK